MLPRFWGASAKRCKDAGVADSCTIGDPEDAAARRVIAPQKPGGHSLKGHYTFSQTRAALMPMPMQSAVSP